MGRERLLEDGAMRRAHAQLGALYEKTGQLDEAVRTHRRAAALAGPNFAARATLARVLATAGRSEEARRILEGLQAEADRTGIHAPAVAVVLLALNDVEGAFRSRERSYEQRHPQLRHVGGPGWARIAADPRYLDLRRRIGLR